MSKDIFISHSTKNKPFVRQLVKDFESNGISAWVDEAELFIGDSLIDKIQENIDRCKFFAIIISKDMQNSSWVKTELKQALEMEIRENKVKILPIFLEHTEIPGFLRDKLYADFSKWPTDQGQYESSLALLVRSIKARLEPR